MVKMEGSRIFMSKKLIAACTLSIAGLALAAGAQARSQEPSDGGWGGWGGWDGPPKSGGSPGHFSAPEIDPTSTISALTLLLGGVIVLRSRSVKR